MLKQEYRDLWRQERINKSEIWKDIIWYEWLYQVSSLGRIKSLWCNHCNNSKEKLLKLWNRKWYKKVWLYKNKIYSEYSVHRLVAQVFLWLNINDTKTLVCHKNDIKDDNRAENLFLWTHKDNTQDMLNKWRHISAYKWKFWIEHNKAKNIWQFDIDWILIKKFNWWYEIQRELWFSAWNINKCCNWKRKTAYGYIWKHI